MAQNKTGVAPKPGADPEAARGKFRGDDVTGKAVGNAMRAGWAPEGEGWTDVSGGGPIFAWEVGKSLRGVYRGMREGQFGADTLADIITHEQGLVTIGVPTTLRSSLRSVPIGDEVSILCNDEVETERGLNPAKLFKVHHRMVQQSLKV